MIDFELLVADLQAVERALQSAEGRKDKVTRGALTKLYDALAAGIPARRLGLAEVITHCCPSAATSLAACFLSVGAAVHAWQPGLGDNPTPAACGGAGCHKPADTHLPAFFGRRAVERSRWPNGRQFRAGRCSLECRVYTLPMSDSAR